MSLLNLLPTELINIIYKYKYDMEHNDVLEELELCKICTYCITISKDYFTCESCDQYFCGNCSNSYCSCCGSFFCYDCTYNFQCQNCNGEYCVLLCLSLDGEYLENNRLICVDCAEYEKDIKYNNLV